MVLPVIEKSIRVGITGSAAPQRRRGLLLLLFVLFVGAAAAPTHALAAGCSGTGACYWVDAPGSGARNWTIGNI